MKQLPDCLRGLLCLVWVAVLLAVESGLGASCLSPANAVFAPDNKTLYVACATANQVIVVDAVAGKILATIALSEPPNGLALTSDNQQLIVTSGAAEGRIRLYAIPGFREVRSWSSGHTPMAPTLSQDGCRLYVCNRFQHQVAVFDLPSGARRAEVPVRREPVAAVLSGDERLLFVANHLPAGPANEPFVAAVVSVIATDSRRVVREIPLANGSTAVRGMTLSADGRFLFVTHTLGRFQVPTTQAGRGWMNTAALSIIDTAQQKRLNTVVLDDPDLGAADPWGVACSADNRWILVAHAGSHELTVVDWPATLARLTGLTQGRPATLNSSRPEDVPRDLAFMAGMKRRIKLPGKGPRGLALASGRAYVAQYFSDSLAVVDLADATKPEVRSMPLGPALPISQERLGEMLFHDATISFQSWQSCATCHPDARADGLNWDLLNDGIGKPKNTKSLLLAHQTPPSMTRGVRPNAESAVRSGLRYIEFAMRPEKDAQAIDAYLKSLQPVMSPYRLDGEFSPAAQRGEKVFEECGCAACHPPPLRTDLHQHNVGTGAGRETNVPFDTPTLIEAWRTAPHLHDGRAATIQEIFRKFNPNDRHGHTARLTPAELDDLVEFVLSL